MRTLLTLLATTTAFGAPARAQVYELTVEETVRTDNPRLQPDLSLVVDTPRPIDKQSFRRLQSDEFAPDTVYVRFLPGVDASTREFSHAAAGALEVVWQSQLVDGLYGVRVVEGRVPEAIDAYLDEASTLYAEPSYRSRPGADPNDSQWNDSGMWGMKEGNGGAGGWGSYARWAWDEWQGDPDFVVAVIDSGVQWPQSDLLDNTWLNPGEIAGNGIDDDNNGYVDDIRGWNVADENGSVLPCGSDHGTHVAGTIGAVGNNGVGVAGVNWRCSLMVVMCDKVVNGECDGLYDTVEGIDYAAANGARVSNNSYGSDNYSQSAYDVILAAQAEGHIFVAAAGNDGVDVDQSPFYPAGYALSNIIQVAALEADGDFAESDPFENSFDSNFGDESVDLAAPGVGILSTVIGGYAEKNGTSMAAPHVAGAVALVWSKYPHLPWTWIRERVVDGGNVLAALDGKVIGGRALNAQRALGVWISPTGTGSQVGTAVQPYAFWQLGLALQQVPRHGHLNLRAGTISKSTWTAATQSAGAGSEPIILTAHDGLVRIGVQ